jgi:hypothetical protein
MTAPTINIYDEDGEPIALPARWEICHRCEGNGTHVNPAVDGWDPTDWDANDEDFRENYFAGVYDIRCDQCAGSGKVQVPDPARLTPAQQEAWEAWQRDEAEYHAIVAMERRMGA